MKKILDLLTQETQRRSRRQDMMKNMRGSACPTGRICASISATAPWRPQRNTTKRRP